PAMRPNWRSSGVATAEAIVSGLAPGRLAETWIVGNSTCGSGETGREKEATPPASATAIVSRVVPMGRSMNGDERLAAPPSPGPLPRSGGEGGAGRRAGGAAAGHAAREAIEVEVDDRGRVERQDLREDQAADDRDAERLAQLRADAPAEGQGDARE